MGSPIVGRWDIKPSNLIQAPSGEIWLVVGDGSEGFGPSEVGMHQELER
jgi:hypothetical protein